MPLSLLKFSARVILAMCVLVFANAALAQTKLYIRSQFNAGSIGVNGRTYTTADGIFAVTGSAIGDTLAIQAANLRIQLGAQPGQVIGRGDVDILWQDAAGSARPSMNVSDIGYAPCIRVSGRFHVLELVRDPQGNVTSLAVNFEQRCGDNAGILFGQFRYNSALPTDTTSRIPEALIFLPVINAAPGGTQISNATAVTAIDAPIPVSISGGEYSVNNAAFSSAVGTVKNGDSIRLRVTAPPLANAVATTVLNLNNYLATFSVGTAAGITPQPTAGGLIYLYAQPKYGAMNAKTSILNPATIQEIGLGKSINNSADERGIRVTVRQSGGGPFSYGLDFYAAAGGAVEAGNYFRVGTSPASGGAALMQSSGYSNLLGEVGRCDYGSGQELTDVVVSEVEYASDGRPTKLAMDFVATCNQNASNYARVFGHIRVNSTVPIDYAQRLPIPFDFPGVVGATTSTAYVSATGSATGITVPVAVTISGGEYSIGSGAFTAAAGVINDGETIRVRLTSASTANAVRVAILDIGGVKFPFSVGTATGTAPQPTTDPLLVLVSVPRSAAQSVQTRVYSPATLDPFVVAKRSYSPAFAVTVSPIQTYNSAWSGEFLGANATPLSAGIFPIVDAYPSVSVPSLYLGNSNNCYQSLDSSIRMSVAEVEYAIDGLPSKLAVDFAMTCGGSELVTQYGYLRINSTLPINYAINTPAPFPFVAQTGLARGVIATSNEVTMRAMNVPAPISVAGGEYSIDGASFTAMPGIISPAQSLRLRATASAQSDTALTTSVTVGQRVETFTVATAPDALPQPHGPPLVVFYSQDYATGLVTQKVVSAATLATALLSPASFSDARTVVRLDTLPSAPNNYQWQLVLAGPDQSLLQVGSYVCSGDNSTPSGARCSSYSNSNGTLQAPACYYSNGAGSLRPSNFIVREIEHSVAGDTLRLALDFIDNCRTSGLPSTGTAAVFAFIRINSTIPIDHSIRQPIPFYFAPAIDAVPATLVRSEEISIKGINVDVPISIVGGEYSIDGAAFTSASGTISPGQRVAVRVTASAMVNAVAAASLTVGGVSGDFRVGTSAGFPPVANGNPLVYLISQGNEPIGKGRTYTFSSATNVEVTTVRSFNNTVSVVAKTPFASDYESWLFAFGGTSATALVPGTYTMLAGYATTNGPASMRVRGPGFNGCDPEPGSRFTVYEIDYGGSIVNGLLTRLAVDFVNYCQGYADPMFGYIRINSNVAINPIADTVPAPFAFAQVSNIARGMIATSMAAVLTGFNLALPISVSNGEYSLDGAAFTTTPGIVNTGQSVRIRTVASLNFGGLTIATLTVGSITASFSVYSEFLDSYPDNIVFANVANAPRSGLVASAIVVIAGINVPTPISFIQGGEVSVGGRAFTSMPTTILPGETLQMRLFTGAQYNTLYGMSASIGGNPTVFNVQTLAQGVLQVTVVGSGRVDIAPVGATCSAFCSSLYDAGSRLTLTATPASGFAFSGWSGAGCTGNAACVITLALTAQVTATFAALPPGAPVLSQAVAGDGRATLVFTPTGVSATAYTATCLPGSVTASAASSPMVVSGLTNDTAYQCSVTASNAGGVSGASNSLAVTPSATAPVVLVGVVSRKLHGAAGAFEVPIDQSAAIAGNVTVEPRVIGAGHTLVFQFNSPITNAGSVTMTDSASNAVGSASTALGAFGEVVVTATGVADNKRVTITLGNINGIAALNASVSVGFLVGDVNNTRSVNASDISGIKSRSGLATDASNFRFDVNASGAINASDISTVKARSGLTLIP